MSRKPLEDFGAIYSACLEKSTPTTRTYSFSRIGKARLFRERAQNEGYLVTAVVTRDDRYFVAVHL